jgi:YrbI family 3-deoxy-D-manno-octulosonate 8-phosphate phosphatase
MNIAFIPARCASKFMPFKNIKDFCGKPLIFWNLKALQESKNIDKVFVATDCKKIERVVNSFKFSKVNVYVRNSENGSDTATSESVMLEFLDKNSFNDKDLFLLVQASSPLTQASDFDGAIKALKVQGADSIVTCVRSRRFIWNKEGVPVNYDYMNRPRRQDFEGFLMENGAFYISSVKNIKETNNRISGKVITYEMEEYTSVEIDEEVDWIFAEGLMHKFILKEKGVQKIKLFLSDVDGTLTDASMYYGESGEELKNFNTHDGMGFSILKKNGIKIGIVTSEDTKIVQNRAKKLKVDYLGQGLKDLGKLNFVKEICKKEGIGLNEVSYIGDDINCKELLESVGLAACPSNSVKQIKSIQDIIKLDKSGGNGAVREFADYIIENNLYINKEE